MTKKKMLSSLQPIIKPLDIQGLLKHLAELPTHTEYELLVNLPHGNLECSMMGGYELTPLQLDQITEIIPKLQKPNQLIHEFKDVSDALFQGGENDLTIL